MALYAVSYDLHNVRHYQPVWDLLAKIGGVRVLESLWLVSNTATAVQIKDAVKAAADKDDSVVVLPLDPNGQWAVYRAQKLGADWLLKNIP